MNIKEFIPLLKCIKESQIDLSSWDVLTFRNNLNKIMATPYSSNKWEVEIFKIHQFVFLGVISLDSNSNPKFVYWGYKFEQYCTATSKEELNEVVNPNNQTFIVGRTKIGQNRILFGAEMDSLEPNSSGYNFIEIKTNRIIDNAGSSRSFQRHKLLSIWIQSYLAGVDKVFIGYRDDNGIVRNVNFIKTTDIPAMVNQIWDPSVCITFTNAVINMIKDNTQHNKQYTLSYDGFKIRLKESQREPFVPPEFLQHLEGILNNK
uniref:Decapping nuclease n=1 Tax=Arcella intermedia TaxID=1963864 RepID=A0A6B2LB30_9EUKA